MIQRDGEILGRLIVHFECDHRYTVGPHLGLHIIEHQHAQHVADAAEDLGAEAVAAAQQTTRYALHGLGSVHMLQNRRPSGGHPLTREAVVHELVALEQAGGRRRGHRQQAVCGLGPPAPQGQGGYRPGRAG